MKHHCDIAILWADMGHILPNHGNLTFAARLQPRNTPCKLQNKVKLMNLTYLDILQAVSNVFILLYDSDVYTDRTQI